VCVCERFLFLSFDVLCVHVNVFVSLQLIFRDARTVERVAYECVVDRFAHGVRSEHVRVRVFHTHVHNNHIDGHTAHVHALPL